MHDFKNQYYFLEKPLHDEIELLGTPRVFKPGEVLIREGQFITNFPLVLSGLIKVSRNSHEGSELLLYYLKKNDVCAMSLTCCMTNLKSTVNAVAEEETSVIMLPVHLLEPWMCKYPTWKSFLMQTFQSRFRELIDTIDAVAFLNLDERLVRYFTDRYTKTGNATLSVTHQELALKLNTSREVISRLLKKLENDGKIKLSRNFIDFTQLV
jgi:CRP/FNR family transcriptional regulator